MTTPILHADPCPQCGDGGGAGGCDPGEECLPSDYVAPCDEGSECLPSNYIDPDDCAGVVADYIPYALSASGSDVDTVILATSPFGYWKLDEASGTPQDSSGNGNHATGVVGSATYHAGAILPTVGESMGFPNATAGDAVTFPAPVNLGHAGSEMAMCALVAFDGAGEDGSGNSPWRMFMGSDASDAFMLGYFDNNSGSTLPIDGVFQAIEGVNNNAYSGTQVMIDTTYTDPNVFFIVLNAIINGAASAMELWVNGVLIGNALRSTSLGGTPDLRVGSDGDAFWGAPEMRASNVAAWDHTLTAAEIQTLTEAILDSATLAASWVPA